MTKRARIRVNHLAHNISVIRNRCPGSPILGYVKANAYGHGIEQIVPYMSVDMLAVADIDEALRVRAVGYSRPVLVQSCYYSNEDWQVLLEHDLTPLLHAKELFMVWSKLKPADQRFWIKYDTGMSRLGMYLEDVRSCLDISQDTVVMTHMAHEGMDARNLDAIAQVKALQKDYSVSVCYAPTTLLNTDYKIDASDWIAPGIALYGIGMSGLKLVMALQAQVIAVKDIPPHAQVGYGGLYKADCAERIAIVAIGYADGLPQSIGAYDFLTEQGETCTVVGQVSMDMVTVKCPKQVNPGEWLTVWSKVADISYLAASSSRSPYALFSQLGQRVKRELSE